MDAGHEGGGPDRGSPAIAASASALIHGQARPEAFLSGSASSEDTEELHQWREGRDLRLGIPQSLGSPPLAQPFGFHLCRITGWPLLLQLPSR
jgi:hypothetical protein